MSEELPEVLNRCRERLVQELDVLSHISRKAGQQGHYTRRTQKDDRCKLTVVCIS